MLVVDIKNESRLPYACFFRIPPPYIELRFSSASLKFFKQKGVPQCNSYSNINDDRRSASEVPILLVDSWTRSALLFRNIVDFFVDAVTAQLILKFSVPFYPMHHNFTLICNGRRNRASKANSIPRSVWRIPKLTGATIRVFWYERWRYGLDETIINHLLSESTLMISAGSWQEIQIKFTTKSFVSWTRILFIRAAPTYTSWEWISSCEEDAQTSNWLVSNQRTNVQIEDEGPLPQHQHRQRPQSPSR